MRGCFMSCSPGSWEVSSMQWASRDKLCKFGVPALVWDTDHKPSLIFIFICLAQYITSHFIKHLFFFSSFSFKSRHCWNESWFFKGFTMHCLKSTMLSWTVLPLCHQTFVKKRNQHVKSYRIMLRLLVGMLWLELVWRLAWVCCFLCSSRTGPCPQHLVKCRPVMMS